MQQDSARNALAAAVALAIWISPATAIAQDNGAQGSSILRVSPIAINDPYEHPRIYFLGRAAQLLPPAYSYVYPFGTVEYSSRGGYVVREFRPLDRNGHDTFAQTHAKPYATDVRHRRRSHG